LPRARDLEWSLQNHVPEVSPMTTSYVHATYRDQRTAVQAAEALLEAKFPARDISALLCDADSEQAGVELKIRHKTQVPIGALIGGIGGLVLGAVIAWLAQVHPDPQLFAVRGAVIGAAIGTLAGALGGLGRWRDTILFPEGAFKNGCVVVGVNTHETRVNEARRVLDAAGGGDVEVSTKRAALNDVRARATATEAL
jgi:hypothetical protein